MTDIVVNPYTSGSLQAMWWSIAVGASYPRADLEVISWTKEPREALIQLPDGSRVVINSDGERVQSTGGGKKKRTKKRQAKKRHSKKRQSKKRVSKKRRIQKSRRRR